MVDCVILFSARRANLVILAKFSSMLQEISLPGLCNGGKLELYPIIKARNSYRYINDRCCMLHFTWVGVVDGFGIIVVIFISLKFLFLY